MKVTLESTTRVVSLRNGNSAPMLARIWEGRTETGIPVRAFVTRISVQDGNDQTEFDRELRRQRSPRPDETAVTEVYFL